MQSIERRGVDIFSCFFPRSLFSAHDFSWRDAVYFGGESHPYYELVYVADGVAEVTEEERVFTLTRKTAVLHAPREFHRLRTTAPARVLVLSFSSDVPAPSRLTEGVLTLTEEESVAYEELFSAARRIYYSDARSVTYHDSCTDMLSAAARVEEVPVTPLFAAQISLRLGALLVSLADRETVASGTEEVSAAAREYREIAHWMRTHADEPLTLGQIAEQFHTSVSRIKKLFARHAGLGPKQFFLRRRVERCCELLADGTLSERQIAERMGFSSAAYFSLFFKQQTGRTPSDYRRQAAGAVSEDTE